MFEKARNQKLDTDEITWLQRATMIRGSASIKMALAILGIAIRDENFARIVIHPETTEDIGLQRSTAYRALSKLKKAGLITVERKRGRSPVVSVIEEGDIPISAKDPFANLSPKDVKPFSFDEVTHGESFDFQKNVAF